MIPIPEDGAIWGCRVNAHRDGWNGTDCHDPIGWECGGQQSFREHYCVHGARRCYHVSLFRGVAPSFVIEQKGGWLFAEDRHAWDGQVVLLYSFRAREPHGKLSDEQQVVVGFYVVERVVELEHGRGWRIEPREVHRIDGIELEARELERVGRPYLVHFPARVVRRLLDHWEERTTSELDRRFIHALRERYIPDSTRRNRELGLRHRVEYDDGGFSHNPFRQSLSGLRAAPPPTATPSPLPPPAAPPVAPAPEPKPLPQPLLQRSALEPLRTDYARDTLDGLWLGTLRPNALAILRGDPGVGKSRLATALLDDDTRMFLLTVASTWRGREDLLGYANPVTGRFVPTPFAGFLHRAARAWLDGDRAPFLAVLEEFNLSAPEHWFSDLLVLSQYPPEAQALRTLRLPGSPPDETWSGDDDHTAIFLSPAVRFIATINTDHTTQPLSPRVLDRAALITVQASVDRLLGVAGLSAVDPAFIDAIKSIAESFRPFGAHFSRRTALGLHAALDAAADAGMSDTWSVIDLVLASQVLGAVRIYAGRLEVIDALEAIAASWDERYGGRLPRCYTLLEEWLERLHQGRDVIQA